MISAEPPAETSGSGIADHRRQADDDGDVHERLADDPAQDRARGDLDERVGVPADHADHGEREQPEQAEDEQRADQAELLAEDREDEVVVRGRQVGPLLAALAEAEPAPAAAGQPPAAVQRLVARRRGVALVREPGRDPVRAVGAASSSGGPSGPRRAARRSRTSRIGTPATNSAPATSRMSTSAVPRSCPARTHEDRDAGDRHRGDHGVLPLAQQRQLAGQDGAQPDGERELDGLRRLRGEARRRRPSSGCRRRRSRAG